MILDSVLQFSDAQELTSVGSASADVATNVVDLGAVTTGKDAFGNDEAWDLMSIRWFVNIQVAMVGEGEILYCNLVTGASISSGAISSSVALAQIAFPALSPAGTKKSTTLQYEAIGRYLNVEFTATSSLTSVTVDSGLILGYNDSSAGVKFTG